MVRQGGPARSGSQDGKAADKRLLGPGRGALDALGHFLGVGIAPVPGIGNEAKPRQRLAQTVEVQFAPADMIGHLLPVRHPVGGKVVDDFRRPAGEAAKMLGVSSKYLRMLIQAGKIEAVPISHLWLIKDEEVARVDHLRVMRLLGQIEAIETRVNDEVTS